MNKKLLIIKKILCIITFITMHMFSLKAEIQPISMFEKSLDDFTSALIREPENIPQITSLFESIIDTLPQNTSIDTSVNTILKKYFIKSISLSEHKAIDIALQALWNTKKTTSPFAARAILKKYKKHNALQSQKKEINSLDIVMTGMTLVTTTPFFALAYLQSQPHDDDTKMYTQQYYPPKQGGWVNCAPDGTLEQRTITGRERHNSDASMSCFIASLIALMLGVAYCSMRSDTVSRSPNPEFS